MLYYCTECKVTALQFLHAHLVLHAFSMASTRLFHFKSCSFPDDSPYCLTSRGCMKASCQDRSRFAYHKFLCIFFSSQLTSDA
jgi:hypothetical protein